MHRCAQDSVDDLREIRRELSVLEAGDVDMNGTAYA
jgi:hypothetical protein